jgi:hypothetical protein
MVSNYRIRYRKGKVNVDKIVWTMEMKTMLLGLVNDERNIGYVEIAKHMTKCFEKEFTKNSCIGMARRLKAGPRPVKMRKKISTVLSKKIDAPIDPVLEPRKEGLALTIYQLREGDCKFPLAKVGEYPPYMFCGHPAILGTSWCKDCTEKVFSNPTSGNAKSVHRNW